MKVKQLLAAALLFCTAGAWAQTDVTSTYLTNPSFEYSAEGTNSTAQALTNGGTYYGWTLPSLGTSFVNISIGDANACNGQAFGIPTAKEGTYYYYERRGWNSSTSAESTMSTTLQNLPIGHYELTMNYKGLDSWDDSHTSKGSYLKIEAVEGTTLGSIQTTTFEAVKGNSAGANKFTTDANWKDVSLTFDVATAGDVTLNILHHLVGGVRTDVVIDNLTLTYTDPEAAAHAAALDAAKYTLDGYIKKATALNGVLSNATLATAIETAQGQYNEAKDWAEDFDNTVSASTALNSAITSALSSATPVALNNGTFDSTPNNTLNGDGTTTFGGTLSTATSNPDNTKEMTANTGDHGYLYEVTGWTQFSKFNSTAAQGTTSEYGTAMPANGWSTNSTTPPATDMFGATAGAALHLSAGWGDQGRYQQTIENLPAGRYVLYYEVINQHNNTGIASNYIGVNGAAGDFYGTTDKFVYSNLKTIEQGVWKAQAFEFDVAKAANINFSVGVTTSTNGSGNGAKLWIDNYLVYRIGDITMSESEANAILEEVADLDESVYNASDKSALAAAKSAFEGSKTLDNYNALNNALVTAQASVAAYKTLNTAITNVEEWSATAATTAIRSKYTNGEYADDVTAADIYAEYQAAEIAAIVDAGGTDFTSVILNHSFETNDMTGWTATSRSDTGVKSNDDATYTINNDVDGDYIFNSWGGADENNVYQTIKNLPAGTYQLSAVLAGFTGEELILAANEKTNSVIVSGDKTTGNIVNVIFTLADAADVVIKASNTKATSADASFIKADNFTLKAYSDPLAALKEQLAALQTQAETLLANDDYANVTGDEKTTLTTLSTLVPEETEEAYNTAISNITAAISDFTGAKSNYDALATVNAEVAALATLTYADAAKKPAAVSATTAEEAATKADAQTAAIRAYYESNALAEGVAGAVNQTSKLTNPTNPTSTSGWTVNNTTGNSNMRTMSSEPYTNADGTTATGYFDSNSWGTAFASTFTQDVELEAGKYILTAKARGNGTTTYQVVANGETTDIAAINNSGGVFGRGWNDYTVEFTINAKTTVTLGINMETGSSANWLSFGDFRLVRLELYTTVADANDYSDLAAAIATAEAKTLGFEAGEYAPYNNVAALTALAAAKAIDPTVENMQEDVQAATAALTSATWTANAAEVDAIFDGQFATTAANATAGDINLPGWTKVQGIRLLVKDETVDPGLAYTDGKAAVFSWGGTTLTYGEQTGYTLPLNQHSIYELTLKVSGWRDGDMPTYVSADMDGTVKTASPTVAAINTAEGNPFATLKFYVTPTAESSVLKIYGNKHFTVADLSMKLAVAEDMTINDNAEFAQTEEKFANVTLNRSFKKGYNSVVLPFAMTAEQVAAAFGQDAKVYAYSESSEDPSDATINFNSKDENTIEANVPVLLGGVTETNQITVSSTLVKTAEAKVSGTNFDFVGTYAPMTVENGDYFIGNGAVYKSSGATSMNAFRAYIKAKGASGEVKLFIDGGLATGISEINGAAATGQGAIYNLAGQRVSRAQNGIYIVNGKKVAVK